MKKSFFFSRLLVASALCLALASPALAADAAAKPAEAKPAAEKSSEAKPAAAKSATAKPEKAKPATARSSEAKPQAPAKSDAASGSGDPAPAKKSSAAAPKASAPAGKKTAPAGPANSPEALQKGLDEFARTTIASLNRHVVPSLNKKEVSKNADGSFTARYIEIDPASIRTSYKTPDKPGPVSHIGYMSYTEIEYHCTDASRAGAEKGPFKTKNSKMLTELVKCVNGKWTY